MDDASKCQSGGSRINWAVPVAISAACVTASSVALAQEQSSQDQVFAQDEVVVVAQKRFERLQDVPVATSVITGTSIQRNNIRNLQDLTANVPSFVVANDTSYNQGPLAIRGVGGANAGGNVFADEPVAVYVDEAYSGRLRYSATDLLDVEAIEVLRGPQGTLYGRNSTAGAVLIRTAQPTAELHSYANVIAAQDDEYRFTGALSGPLISSGALSARLAVGYSDYDGWADNVFNNGKLGSSKDQTGRLTFKFAPSDKLTMSLIGEYADHQSQVATLAVSDLSNLADEINNPTGTNVVTPYVQRANLDALLDSDQFALNVNNSATTRSASTTFKLDWKLGAVTLTSISNYRKGDTLGTQDSDGNAFNPPTPPTTMGDVPNFGDNDVQTEDAQYSQELRLSSRDLGGLDWVAGLYYYGENNDLNPIRIRNRLAGPLGSGTQATFNSSQDTEAYAAFVDVSYNVTERLRITGGGRYSDETKDFRTQQLIQTINQVLVGPMFPAGTVLAAPAPAGSADFTDFSPRAVINYKWADKISTYVSFSEGFKSGGFNAFGTVGAFQPEQIEAYEIGLKSDLLDDRLRFNTALFFYNYENLQVRTPVPQGGVGIQTVNTAEVNGAEIEATFLATQNLRFDAVLAYLDAEFKNGSLNTVATQAFPFGAPPAPVMVDVSGNDLSRAPEYQGALNARYSRAMFGGRGTAQLAYRYQDSVFFLETQQQANTFRADSWDEVDARLSFGAASGRWEVAVYGKNLADDRHISQVGSFFGLPLASVNEPRRVGLQFSFEY